MSKTLSRSVALLVLAPVLTACGGGGGSGSATPFTSFNDLPETGTVELQGQARTARFAVDPVTGQLSLSNLSDTEDSTLRLTTTNGLIPRVAIRAPDSAVAFDLDQGATVQVDGPVVFFESDDGRRFALLLDGGRGGPFEYQTLGAWLDGFGAERGTLGAGAYGARTPSARLPTGQVATYVGEGAGFARRADGEGYLTISAIEVTTDFRQAEILSTQTQAISLATSDTIPAPELDFDGSGPVSGAGFTAAVSGPGSAGEAQGVFHGPNAEEVAGTYSLSGPGGVAHIGAFGGN